MTRRGLVGPTDDVESQSRAPDVSDGFSERSSTLPTYEDVVGETPALAQETSKGNDGKMSEVYRSFSDAESALHRSEEEHLVVTSGSEHGSGSTSRKDRTKQRKTIWKRYFWVMAAIILWYILACSLHFFPETGKHTPPPSEPESNGPFWPSPREIRVHEATKAIHGTFPLYDLLELSTLTGAIHVTIEPKAGNKTAVVRVKSKTGAIHVRFAKPAFSNADEKGVFDRVYNTRMDTITGQIHAEALHGGSGGETVLTTKTGLLDLRVTPIGDQASRVETSTMTGLNKVIVEAPMQGSTLKNLTAIHRTRTSGMLDVNYPREWEGRVHAWCKGTGQVDVQGEGLHVQGRGTDVYAWRGEDAAKNGKTIEAVSEGTGMVRFHA